MIATCLRFVALACALSDVHASRPEDETSKRSAHLASRSKSAQRVAPQRDHPLASHSTVDLTHLQDATPEELDRIEKAWRKVKSAAQKKDLQALREAIAEARPQNKREEAVVLNAAGVQDKKQINKVLGALNHVNRSAGSLAQTGNALSGPWLAGLGNQMATPMNGAHGLEMLQGQDRNVRLAQRVALGIRELSAASGETSSFAEGSETPIAVPRIPWRKAVDGSMPAGQSAGKVAIALLEEQASAQNRRHWNVVGPGMHVGA